MVYCGLDHHIHELSRADNGWSHNDLTTAGGADADPIFSIPAGYVFNAQGTKHVAFCGLDGHIHELWCNDNGWQPNDLTVSAGALQSANAKGKPHGYVFDAQGTQHVVYRGTDGHIHELWFKI